MGWTRPLSVRQKLTGMILLASLLVLTLTSGFFILLELQHLRSELRADARTLGGILATNSRQGIILRDVLALDQILASLQAHPGITTAYLFDANQQTLAAYFRSAKSHQRRDTRLDLSTLYQEERQLEEGFELQSEQFWDEDGWLSMLMPIQQDGRLVGYLFMRTELSQLRHQLSWFGLAWLVIVGVATLIAYLLSARLHKAISEPVQVLVEQMEGVAHRHDLARGPALAAEDEFAVLFRGYNEMVAGLQERDRLLRQHRQSLEEQVRTRTRQLQDAMEQAEQASETKSRFLANMSHEIRTPMIGVLGMADLLRHANLAERERELAETLYNSGEALLEILNDILDFSKIEAGKLEIESLPFNLRQISEEVLELLAEKAAGKGLELILRMAPQLPEALVGDAGRIRQILLNLVGNAIKFTGHGEVEVTIRATAATDEADWDYQIAVRDTGIGISPTACDKIFAPFAQADSSMTRNYGGTGLGLAIVRELAALMNGSISVSSVPDQGSCFTLSLKLCEQPERVALVTRSSSPRTARSVLLAIPNRAASEAAMELLTGLGYHVDRAAPDWPSSGRLLTSAVAVDYQFCLLDGDHAGNVREALSVEFSPTGRLSATVPIILVTPEQYRAVDGTSWAPLPNQRSLLKPLRGSRLVELFGDLVRPAAPVPRLAPRQFRARVLLAEDNPTTRKLLGILLDSAGLQVDMVENGRLAVEHLSANPVDLVFMDCQMPVLDGFAATLLLRATGFETPIVALTAYARQEDEERCLAAGMSDFLCKPFRQDDLWAILAKWLPAEPAVDSAVGTLSVGTDHG